MKTVRSLPPELQALIDQYNQLLQESGYTQQYYDMDAQRKFMAEYFESGFDLDKVQGPKIFQESGLTREEFDARDNKIRDLYSEIIRTAEDLQSQGKIQIGTKPDPLYNKEGDGSNTFAFQFVKDPGLEEGSTSFGSAVGHSPALPQFIASGPPPLEPMKTLKLNRKELPPQEIKDPVPMDVPKLKKELIMRNNPRMRTGQEPNYYIVKDGNRTRMIPVEDEELQYYRSKNKIPGAR